MSKFTNFIKHPIRSIFDLIMKPFLWILNNLKTIFFNVNMYTIIPIIIKILLDIFSKSLPLVYNIVLRFLMGSLSIIFANMLQIIREEDCKKDTSALKILINQIYVSFIQYAGAYILPTIIIFLLDFIGVGETIMVGEEIPIIGHFVQLLFWIVGFSISTWITNITGMNNKCSGHLTSINHYMGIAAIIAVIGYEGFHAII